MTFIVSINASESPPGCNETIHIPTSPFFHWKNPKWGCLLDCAPINWRLKNWISKLERALRNTMLQLPRYAAVSSLDGAVWPEMGVTKTSQNSKIWVISHVNSPSSERIYAGFNKKRTSPWGFKAFQTFKPVQKHLKHNHWGLWLNVDTRTCFSLYRWGKGNVTVVFPLSAHKYLTCHSYECSLQMTFTSGEALQPTTAHVTLSPRWL